MPESLVYLIKAIIRRLVTEIIKVIQVLITIAPLLLVRAAIPNEIAEAERHGCRQGKMPRPGQRNVYGSAVVRGADHGQAEDKDQQHSQGDVEDLFGLLPEPAKGLDQQNCRGHHDNPLRNRLMPAQGEDHQRRQRDAPQQAQVVTPRRQEGQEEHTQQAAVGVGRHGQCELNQVGIRAGDYVAGDGKGG